MTPTQNDESRVADESTSARKEATARPWLEFADQGNTIAIIAAGIDGDVCVFAEPYPTRANAALIVEAVNALEPNERRIEELTEALRECVNAWENRDLNSYRTCEKWMENTLVPAIESARAALEGTKA